MANHRQTRARKKKRAKQAKRECWYYDACTLSSVDIIGEIVNQNHNSVISHLAIGESIANEYYKNGVEAGRATVELFEKLVDLGKIKIVGHDDVIKPYDAVRERFSIFSVTDTLHLATAIKHRCTVLKSADGDFCNNPRPSEIKKFVKDNYTFDLKVKRVDF